MKGVLSILSVAALFVAALDTEALALDTKANTSATVEEIKALNKKALPAGEPLVKAVLEAVMIDAAKRHRCAPTSVHVHDLRAMTLDRIVGNLIAQGAVENGWVVSADLVDCPPADSIRLLLVRGPDGKSLQAFFSGQGETLAWPSLIHDMGLGMAGAAYAKLKAFAPDCEPTEFNPVGGSVVSKGDDLGPETFGIRYRGSWKEIWTFSACGHRIDVPVALKADGSGGADWTIANDKVQFTR